MVKINLTDCPEKLQAEANEYLNGHAESKVLVVTKDEQQIYKDKSIVTTIYKVYLEWANILTVLSFRDCTKKEFVDWHVMKDSMIAGDIQVFVDNCWMSKVLK